MKLIKNKEFLRNIAQQIDLLNTVAGGVAETKVNIDKYKKGAVIRVACPSVSPERYQIVLEKNQLTIMLLQYNNENPELRVPLFSKTFMLPAHINLGKIKAVFENNELQVRLPYYPKSARVIDIEF